VSFKTSFLYAFLASSTLIISAVYSLWLVKRVIYGELKNGLNNNLDANLLEKIILFTLALIVLILGVYPDFMMTYMNNTLQNMTDNIILKI